jgi:hypothetical protein
MLSSLSRALCASLFRAVGVALTTENTKKVPMN